MYFPKSINKYTNAVWAKSLDPFALRSFNYAFRIHYFVSLRHSANKPANQSLQYLARYHLIFNTSAVVLFVCRVSFHPRVLGLHQTTLP